MPVAKIAAVRPGSSRLTSFSTPIARLTSAWPESTSFQAPWKAKEAVAQPPSTLIIGTRSGNSPSSTSGVKATWPRMPPCPHWPMPQLPNQACSISRAPWVSRPQSCSRSA